MLSRLRHWHSHGTIFRGPHLLAAGLIVVCTGIFLNAIGADDDEFNRLVGWANIVGALAASLGLVFWAIDRVSSRTSTSAVLDRMTSAVLASERVQLEQLLGRSAPDLAEADVRFHREVLSYRNAGGEIQGNLDTILEYYEQLRPGRLVALGPPGAGKTVLALELLVKLLDRRRTLGQGPVAVRLSLSSWDASKNLLAWIVDQIALEYKVSRKVLRSLMEQHLILPILDGLDEMSNDSTAEGSAKAVVRAVNSDLANPLVMTCRSEIYDKLSLSVDMATVIYLEPLAPAQVFSYLSRVLTNFEEEFQWFELMDAMRSQPNGLLAELLSSPWRLRLTLTFTQAGGDPTLLLPRDGECEESYRERVHAALLAAYVPAATALYPHRRFPDAQRNLAWLKFIAQETLRPRPGGGSVGNIEVHTWWRVAGPTLTRAIHVGLNLTVLSSTLLAVHLSWGVKLDQSTIPPVGFAVLLSVVAAVNRRPDPARLNMRLAVLTVRSRSILTILALTSGASAILGYRLIGAVGWSDGVIATAVFGLTMFFFVVVTVGIRSAAIGATHPSDPIRNDMAAGTIAGAMFGSLFGATVFLASLVDQPDVFERSLVVTVVAVFLTIIVVTVVTSALCGLLFMIALAVFGAAGAAAVRFAIAAAVLAWRGRSPLRFLSFLNWAYSAGILRISGTTYQFRHRELHEWLAREREESSVVAFGEPAH